MEKAINPMDDSSYGQKMCDDIIKLMEHLSIEKANLFGYSMGAYITYHLLLTKPEIINICYSWWICFNFK